MLPYGRPVSSFIGSASMSARMSTVGPSPFRRIPTTSVVHILVDLIPGLAQGVCGGSCSPQLLMSKLRVLVEGAVRILLPLLDLMLPGEHAARGGNQPVSR